jgi:hypothetical protein
MLTKNTRNPTIPSPADTTKAVFELYKSHSSPMITDAGSREIPMTVLRSP